MAKKNGGSKKPPKPSKQPKKPRVAAWQELVNLLKTSQYVQKVQILSQLQALGYHINADSLSYVMTAARKRGKLCVYTGPKNGYTATPDGHEALVDIRKRRRVSFAWLKNVGPVITYVQANIGKLTNGMKPAEAAELRKEIKHNRAAVQQLRMLTKANGLA